MVTSPQLTAPGTGGTIVRLASPEFDNLEALLFRRYPRCEWATFARFGWRETAAGLVLTLAGLDQPAPGELDETVAHVAIAEPYTLRVALAAERHPLAVGVIHSHPHEHAPRPSPIDDDMDGYYADYLRGFAPRRPYVSLIVSQLGGELVISGRVFFRDEWRLVDRVAAERRPLVTWVGGVRPVHATARRERSRRLADAFGDESASRLRRATVAVIGAGGTGSAAVEVLARAGVGRLIVVDPDHLDESNLERVHGSRPEHAAQRVPKAAVARDHVAAIDPTCVVQAYAGALPQPEIVDALVGADVAVGCTDSQHSRLALSDLALRYLVPAIDCGVMLEGSGGKVTGQVAQFVRFLAADPCALCRGMIIPQRLAQELMPEAERELHRAEAAAARLRGEDGRGYWLDQPQLNTVGYLTTAAGAIAAGYAIGWLTGRFDAPFSRLQMNLVAPYLDLTNVVQEPREYCTCRRVRGWADRAAADSLITAPNHWPAVRRL
jgi:proteasome lid subunit RPN8/RPN11